MARKRANRGEFGFTLPPKLIEHASTQVLEIKGRIKVSNTFGLASFQELVGFLGDVECETKISDVRFNEAGCVTRFDMSILIPVSGIYQLPIHNALRICVRYADGTEDYYGVAYCNLIPKYGALHSKYFKDEDNSLTCFVRQNVSKQTTFTVRHSNVTDSLRSNLKLALAYLCSKLYVWRRPILLFEKNGSHYEESGSVVFERLIDEGHPEARYVLNRALLDQLDLDEKYKRNILVQHSFAHYVNFFRSKTFIGTEALAHALELRCQNLLVQRKLKSKKNTYVFLQHGVMYMISLNSPERSSFRKKRMKGRPFVVASSELEAQHFIDYAGFDREDIIVSGLPKFDRSYKKDGADKIVIMPTWRIWEFNEMRRDPESTHYVQMVRRMVDAIPDDLKEKVVVVKHPLFSESTFLSGHSKEVSNYDELLRETALLITDYSSISYDAFYRGANVVFYWEERDECMAHYGEGTHLMIDEGTAFGPVCFDQSALAEAVPALYGAPQSEEDLRKYHRIVEFQDGRNTDRLIQSLYQLGVISK